MMPAYAVRCAIRFGAAFAIVSALAACQQAPSSLVSPTATNAGSQAQKADDGNWGARDRDLKSSADNASGFDCLLGPYGFADESHATRSASGNETVTCHGKTAAAPDSAQHIEGFPCLLRFGGDGDTKTEDITFDSRAVVTPSGNVTLVCKSKS